MSWQSEYEAFRRGAAFVDLSSWGKLLFSGPDRKKFLNGLLTNDVAKLEPGPGLPVCLLSAKGRLQALFWLYDLETELLALCPPEGLANLRAAVGKVIILSETVLADIGPAHGLLYVAGPGADAVLGRALSQKTGRTSVLPYPRLRPDGRLLLFPEERRAELTKALLEAGAVSAGAETFDILRVEAGLPWFGVDADSETLIQEARLEDAISLTKGCYLGQETVSRVHHLGHVNRILAGLALDGKDPPAPGEPVLRGEREAGAVTSAVWSPRLGAPLALAMLRVEHSEPGTALSVGRRAARVVSLPVAGASPAR